MTSNVALRRRVHRDKYAPTRYLDDGTLEISNNAAEPDAGGERGAAAYTLIETVKLKGLDSEAYLRELIVASPTIPSTALPSCSLEHRPCLPNPLCSLIFAISSAVEPQELPAPRSYRNKLPP